MYRLLKMKLLKLTCAFSAAMIILAVSVSNAQNNPSKKPNVLFIVVDDLNTNLGAYGHAVVKSPNIDRLAKAGVLFERAYSQFPWCCPSRSSFLSGRRPESTRVMDNNVFARTYLPHAVFLPEHFKNNGYFTARVGKIYHYSPSMNISQDDPLSWNVSIEGDEPYSFKDSAKIAFKEHVDTRGAYQGLDWAALAVKDEETLDGANARRAVKILEDASKKTAPFFLAVGFARPHLPWEAPKKYFDLYDNDAIPLPVEPPLATQGLPPVAFYSFGSKPKTFDPFSPMISKRDWQAARAAYYASTSFVDAQIGLLLKTMDELKLWDNTIVVFLGDHGFQLGEHGGMWEKTRLFEEDNRSPLIVVAPPSSLPGTSINKRSPRTVELLDLYPTLIELCQLPETEGLEGASLKPLLINPNAGWNRAAYTVLRRGGTDNTVFGRSVNTERWHYVEFGDGDYGALLYDHKKDPYEYRNLAYEPKYKSMVQYMKQLLKNKTPDGLK